MMKTNNHILTLREIRATPTGENGELMVDVRTYDPRILAEYEQFDMRPYTGDRIFVRDAIARKLARANSDLGKQRLRLRVVYGYRHPEVQKQYFLKQRAILRESNPTVSEEELDVLTHNRTAVPDVAGHPTGGAVDATLVTTAGAPLDMGTKIDFDEPSIPTFSKNISQSQSQNRLILREALMRQEFAPFNGEWWHFSYGDREWACFYGKSASLYSPLDFATER